MDEQVWDALRIAGRILWQHGFWGLFTSALWGLLFAVLGVAISLGAWLATKDRGWLTLGIRRDPWIKGGTLALFLVVVPATLGCAGLVYGAERVTIAALHEEQVVARSCRGAALAITEPVVRAVARQSGTALADDEPCPRVPMHAVWNVRERGHELLAAIERHIVEQELADADDHDLVADAKRFVARRTLSWLRNAALADHDAQIEAYLRAVEGYAAPDGTVGVEDFVTVLATDMLEPQADALVASSFASLRAPLYVTVLGALALPFALLAGLRWWRRRRTT
jgi:hypothetical protein